MQINLTELANHVGERIAYTPLPVVPAIERDVAFSIARDAQDVDLLETMRSAHDLVESVQLFDVYEGSHVADGEKSMAYRIVYRAPERTLTTEEADQAHAAVVNALAKHGATVRS